MVIVRGCYPDARLLGFLSMRTQATESGIALEFQACRGTVSLGDQSAAIEFDLKYLHTGEIELSTVQLPLTRATFFLIDQDDDDLIVAPLSLRAAAPNGTRLASDDLFIASETINHTQNGDTLELQLQTHELDIAWPDTSSEQKDQQLTRLRYWVQGLLGFRVSSVVCGSTEVAVAADSKLDDFRLISGSIQLSLADENPAQAVMGLPDADRLVRRALDLLSLAEGRFLRWCMRDEIVGDRKVRSTIVVRDGGSRPKFAVFSHLNLQPVLDLLTDRFSDELIEKSGVDIAIEWMLMNPSYLEAEFLTLSTALEHLLDRFATAHPGNRSLLPSADFRNSIRPEIERSLRDAVIRLRLGAEEESTLASISARLGGLNSASLPDQLNALLRHHSVPVADIASRIPDLLRLRNRIVHAGQASPDREPTYLLRSVVTLRELLVRILLSIIGFRGHYNSYPGQKWTEFPPIPPKAT